MGISQSVGRNGANLTPDVKLVQRLLNNSRSKSPQFSAVSGTLNVDGLCGPKTVRSIGDFQKVILAHANPDFRVDPGQATWKGLNDNLTSRQSILSTSAPSVSFTSSMEMWLKSQITPHLESIYSNFISQVRASTQEKGASTPGVVPLRQGDSDWGKKLLGHSNRGTIHSYGCALVSLTMAAKVIGSKTAHWPENVGPADLTPIAANEILKKANVFVANSYMLYIVGGAQALGMRAEDSGINKKLPSSARIDIDQVLNNNGFVMVHVDYKGDWRGDHWMLLTEKAMSGEYVGVDPAYGKKIRLFKDPGAGGSKIDHVLLYGRSNSMESQTPENVKNYKVVRFVSLQ